ncbi:MAG: FAD-dependent oxidoreductase [Gammaproteobacteria bacterium]|nr:FAD-dependent oxidoreductase [Gammaproteobacteria bacterium]
MNNFYLPRVAVIGAGLAGLTCATALQGFARVQVFEKSVFVGGRISRYQFGEHRFNHGEQYFTVSNPLFLNIVEAWKNAGLVRPWNGWIVELEHGQIYNLDENTQRYTGYPHMQAITDSLAHNTQVKLSTAIAEIEKQPNGEWRLFDDRGSYLGLFDIVIIATAAHQVPTLSKRVGSIAAQADQIDMTVCWSAMFTFEHSLNLPFDAAYVLDSPLSWISKFQGVDDQQNAAECWVIHSSPEWSLQYAASFRGRVMHALLDAFFEACDINPVKPQTSAVHCWKHATPINTLDQDCLFDEQEAMGACGDWCTSPRIEGAVLSGFSMADRVMKYIKKTYHDQAAV